MVNQIKLDHVDNINKLITPKKTSPVPRESTNATKASDVTVAMNALTGMLADNSPEENARVLEMKQKIESNSYSVDTNALATKLFEHVFSKTIG